MAKADSIEARLERVEAELAIQRLIIDYAVHLDNRNYGGYVGLFTTDGEWGNAEGGYKGHDAILGMLLKIIGPDGAKNDANFHIPSNIQVDVDGDKATAFSRFLFVIRGPDGAPVPALAGAYRDEFVRENGAWKIRRRVAENIMPNSEEWAKIRESRMKARTAQS
jgi:ketosteroid isomerase-like protein